MREGDLNKIDSLIAEFDKGLKTLFESASEPRRKSPANKVENQNLGSDKTRLSLGLMRVNHSGEICAQALYHGQAFTAKNQEVVDKMKHAADEEMDHLAWCEERIFELNGEVSLLNPLWYALSFGLGAGAGLIGDQVSLSFVAATEKQVCEHLKEHLTRLPVGDKKSRAIIEQMIVDEDEHAEAALEAGGKEFSKLTITAMWALSKVMKEASFRV